MRIQQAGGFNDDKARLEKAKKKNEQRGVKGATKDTVNEMNFMKELDNAGEEQVKYTLDQLIEELSVQAKVLTNHRTFEELDKYKKLVKNFMDTAIKKIYSVKVSDSSKLMIKRKKVYVIVEMVDKELEKLTLEMLGKHSDTIDFLGTLDKIRGMLVDMYS